AGRRQLGATPRGRSRQSARRPDEDTSSVRPHPEGDDHVSAEQWFDANSRYLSAALAWVRLLLERQAARSTGTALVPVTQPPTLGASRGWRFGKGPAAPAMTPNAPPPNLANEVERAAEAMAAAEAAMSPPPALAILSELLRLSHFERQVLLLCTAAELDTGIA